MKWKGLMISTLIAVLIIGAISEASAHRWGRGRGYGYGRYYRPRPVQVWVAPPPPVFVGPRYGYYGRPNFYRGSGRYHGGPRHYGHPRRGYGRW